MFRNLRRNLGGMNMESSSPTGKSRLVELCTFAVAVSSSHALVLK